MKLQSIDQPNYLDNDKFVFCLEAIPDIEIASSTEVLKNLEQIAIEYGINSIYKSCDTIESLEESLNALRYDDHNFKDYEIIYLVMEGEKNNICLNDYYYSLEEIAELFEGKLTGKILHFANTKALDLSAEEAQYFIDVTGARAISGYGTAYNRLSSINLDKTFFSLCQDEDDLIEIVEELHQKQYALCKLLDFRLYY
jgi:predicted ribosome quality control (RQC) complex YloA/Tae2 family protein